MRNIHVNLWMQRELPVPVEGKKWSVSVLVLEVCLTDSEGAASFLAIEGQ